MPITPQQIQMAQQQQFLAARDMNPRVLLIAGPGTGKSKCIVERVDYLLSQGVVPADIYVISFTRASVRELQERVESHCSNNGRGQLAQGVTVSTMHSLALRILRSARLLQGFPTNHPMILDDWEQDNIFDAEFTQTIKITSGRAKEIRRAYDAHWQTLQALNLYPVSQPISVTEQQAFDTFHPGIKQVYSCFLPGEVVRRCVDEIRMGNISPAQFPGIRYLIVDEYQDLNECDQEFVQHITSAGASLFVAGDDDQSIYAFRYAAPTGIQQFNAKYHGSSHHQLKYGFRCTPSVLSPASSLIHLNPNRLPKTFQSLYSSSAPPVQGTFAVWRFQTGINEARAIAQSCRDLIAAGMAAKDVLILLSNTKVLLPLLLDELRALNIPFEQPRGGWMLDSPMPRLVFSLLRILTSSQDYVAHRTILGLQYRVGHQTCASIAGKTVSGNLNFRNLFYTPYPAGIFPNREDRAIQRTAAIAQLVSSWNIKDTIQIRNSEIETVISNTFDVTTQTGQACLAEWRTLASSFPNGMTLEELYSYLSSDTEAGQLQIIDAVLVRLGTSNPTGVAGAQSNPSQRVRILTMHGAKGLDGRIVFIPGMEQGILPNSRALQYPGLVNEQRRLLYVSITRARASCILTHTRNRTGQQAKAIRGKWSVNQVRSNFLNEIGIPVMDRTSGLTHHEVTTIMTDCANL